MREAHKRQTEGLHTTVRGLNRALGIKQAELDKAIAEVKRLDGKLVQVDCENLRLNELLATAEEQLAGYQKAVA